MKNSSKKADLQRISVNDLRLAITALLSHLESLGLSEFEFEQDYYWQIDRDQLYTFDSEPSAFYIGQYSEDIEGVRSLASGASEPLALHLEAVAAILHRIGGDVVR